MVLTCCVVKCKNRDNPDSNISFFRFPKVNKRFSKNLQEIQLERRNKWITAVNRKHLSADNVNQLRVCSDHFISGEPAHFQNRTHPDWVPSLRLGYENKKERDCNNRQQRYSRSINRKSVQVPSRISLNEKGSCNGVDSAITIHDDELVEVENDSQNSNVSIPVSNVSTDENESINTSDTQTDAAGTEAEILRLRNQVQELENKLRQSEERANLLQIELSKRAFGEDTFAGNDDLLKHFTGVPNLEFFHFLLDHLKESLVDVVDRTPLNQFQALSLTLMKLRLNHTFIELGYHFKLSNESAAKIFRKVIILFALVFREAIHWPKRDVILKNTPHSFRISKFGTSVTAIIDCFEIRTEKPSGVKAQSKVFSTYKHYHTIKYLIGITSFGLVSTISDGWGGHSSDPTIFADSNFADLLNKGDVVLADRGFGKSCEQLCEKRGALLVTPSYTKGKKQLHPLEYEFSKIVGSHRIHVERVIGQLKNKFAILRGPVSLSMLQYSYNGNNFFDYIVRVCCILNNMYDGIIK